MKCAVVGNSSIILNKEYGEYIDEHDVIIRFNTAKVDGFEKHVGSKTTIRFCNPHPILCLLNANHLKEHTQYFPDWDNTFLFNIKNEKIFFKNVNFFNETYQLFKIIQSRNNELLHIDKHLLAECSTIAQGDPTMGLIGIVYSTKNFEKINCFGFSFYKEQNFHYFEKTIPYKIPHNKNLEEEYIKNLNNSGRITLYE